MKAKRERFTEHFSYYDTPEIKQWVQRQVKEQGVNWESDILRRAIRHYKRSIDRSIRWKEGRA